MKDKIATAEYSRNNVQQRKELLAIMGGKHTKREIQEILALQENRCIYCNVLFTESEVPTRDHLIPITRGGTDWALNIVMACRSCNSRRSTRHFRAYCKSLSPAQKQKIVQHLIRRIDAIELGYVPPATSAEISRLKRIRSRLAEDIAESPDKGRTGKTRLNTYTAPRKRITEAQRKHHLAALLKAVARWT